MRKINSSATVRIPVRFLVLAVAAISILASASQLCAQTFKVLYSFGGAPDGANPTTVVTPAPGPTGYGTTRYGGIVNVFCAQGCGTVFRLNKSGETVVYEFRGQPDGAIPYFGMVRDPAGNLYGTTDGGGTFGVGCVFKIDTTGKESVLYSFMGGDDGSGPSGVLVRDSGGNLYGTTETGGGLAHQGIVFKLDPTGKETILYSFTGGTDGSDPAAGVIRDPAGNLYGTTYAGGSSNHGTIFKVTPGGVETVLYNFAGGTDGANPDSVLIADPSGNLYGTTYLGGLAGVGTVFKLDRTGHESVLYTFGVTDGAYPKAGLLRDTAGNLYGATTSGGSGGVIFKIDTTGHETVLHDFKGGTNDGLVPYAGLVADGAGNLYGTTLDGGSSNNGVVFRLHP